MKSQLKMLSRMVLSAVGSAASLRVPQNPNFLWGFGDPTNFMRLSLMKAAHGVLGGAAYRKFGSFAFFAKGGIRDIRGSLPSPNVDFLSRSLTAKTQSEIRVLGNPDICCRAQDFHGGPVSFQRGPAKPVDD